MARTFGAKNKPKFASVELAELIKMFKTDMRIPIDIKFAKAMQLSVAEVPNLEDNNESDEDVMTPPKIEIL